MKLKFLVVCGVMAAFFAFLFWFSQFLPPMQCQLFGLNYARNATYDNYTCVLGNVTFNYINGRWEREYAWSDYSWMEELVAINECGKVRC